ncbi:MAG: hypothetical protein EDR02_00270 [Actinobacteria bacterium]|nr:MAG: hypothetical protein EDR02_00270 [Actinomycetota bacterium]RIK05775.1 MAG: hypothetical protein DCC48_08895 [Acidobacteriota bacterium]
MFWAAAGGVNAWNSAVHEGPDYAAGGGIDISVTDLPGLTVGYTTGTCGTYAWSGTVHVYYDGSYFAAAWFIGNPEVTVEIAAHEFGHTLGLDENGTGAIAPQNCPSIALMHGHTDVWNVCQFYWPKSVDIGYVNSRYK